jgi:hypothetical protein
MYLYLADGERRLPDAADVALASARFSFETAGSTLPVVSAPPSPPAISAPPAVSAPPAPAPADATFHFVGTPFGWSSGSVVSQLFNSPALVDLLKVIGVDFSALHIPNASSLDSHAAPAYEHQHTGWFF